MNTFTLHGVRLLDFGGSMISIHVFSVLCDLLGATKIAHLFAVSRAVYYRISKIAELETMKCLS
jgi:hypothetical protein